MPLYEVTLTARGRTSRYASVVVDAPDPYEAEEQAWDDVSEFDWESEDEDPDFTGAEVTEIHE